MRRLTLVGLCGAYAWCAVPMKALDRAGKVAEGAVKGCAGGYSIYKVTRARKGVALWLGDIRLGGYTIS